MTLMHRNHGQSAFMRYSHNASMTTHRYHGICFGGQFNSFLKGLFFWWSPISFVKFFWSFGSAIPTWDEEVKSSPDSDHEKPHKSCRIFLQNSWRLRRLASFEGSIADFESQVASKRHKLAFKGLNKFLTLQELMDYIKILYHTVGGRNPAPVDLLNIPFFTGFHTCLVVQDFFHQQYSLLH